MPTNQPETTRADSPEVIARARRTVLLLSGTFFMVFMGTGAQQLYLVPYLRGITDWTPLMCNLVPGMVYLSMMVFRVGNVYLLRKWSNWRLTMVGATTYSLFSVVMLATFYLESYPLALLAAAVWGWGGAAMWAGTTMSILDATDAGRRAHGVGAGTLYAATHGGWLAGAAILGLIYGNPSWQPFSLYIAAIVFTGIGNLMVLTHPRDADFVPQMPTLQDLLVVARRSKVIVAGFLQLTSALSFGIMLGVFGDYIESTYGAQYIWLTGTFYPLVQFCLSYLGGSLADRLGHGTVLAGSFLIAAASMLVAVSFASIVAAALAAAGLAVLSGTVPVVSAAMVGDSADRSRRPLAYGALFVWRDFGVAATAIWSSILMRSTGDFASIFNIFAVVFVVCAFVSLLLRKYARERL